MDLFKLVGRIVISNQEANEAIDETTGKAQVLGTTLQGTGSEADNASKHIGASSKLGSASVWLGNMYTRLTEKGIALGKFIGKTGFKFDANMEAYQNQFEALLNDADKASKLVADLQLLAKVSPLGMEGLANNAVTLLNTGIELADIIPTLEMLGNLSLGDTNKMNSVVRAYTQILSKGQLMAQEMYQLGDAGVPIREIMTMYGGERYADGSWYEEKMSKPTYKIMAEDFVTAMHAATAEGGKWHDYMFKMMDTWNGQVDRMGEEGKESIGAFMNPFFEIAKSDVLPRLSESLAGFGTWVSENQGTLEKMADAVGKLVTGGFDMMINTFTWFIENGEAATAILGGIGAALAVGAIAAHPYAAAIMAVAAGLAWLTSEEAKYKRSYDHFFEGHDQEALDALQRWVEAKRVLKEADDTFQMNVSAEEYDALVDAADAAAQKVNALDSSLIGLYNEWRTGQENGLEYLDVPLRVSEDSENKMQAAIDGMTFEGVVKMYADTSNLNTLYSIASGNGINGSHASGLDNVPFDGYIARLHKGEAVLNSTNAEVWRSGMGNTGILESMMAQMMTVMQQVANNTAGGKQIVLDSGVLVGQLAPAIDTQLGTISSRKGRRN